MIVEHDPDIRFILTHVFEEQGYSVTPFSSEFGVLERVKKDRPDVVVMDIMKPTSQGTTLCRSIKATKAVKHIPIIALSTHVESYKLRSICADHVMGKPFDITELINAVESQVRN